MKRCCRCKTEKPFDQFGISRGLKDGLSKCCKACTCAASRARYALNPEKQRAQQATMRKADPEKFRKKIRDWCAAHPEKMKERSAKRRKEKGDELRAKAKETYAAFPERQKASTAAWADKNKHVLAAKEAKRRAAQLQRTPPWLSEKDFEIMKDIYFYAKVMEEATGIPHHVDHILPLQGRLVSGLHVPDNLQILSQAENCSKSNTWTPN